MTLTLSDEDVRLLNDLPGDLAFKLRSAYLLGVKHAAQIADMRRGYLSIGSLLRKAAGLEGK